MKFIAVFSILLTGALAANNVEYATILLNDVQLHLNEYGSLLQAQSLDLPTQLFNYYKEIITYTDDSFTSVLTDFPVSEVQSVVTEFPWYSSRLETRLEGALTAGSGETQASSSTESSNSTNISASFTSSSFISGNSSIDTLTPIIPTTSHFKNSSSTLPNVSNYSGGANQLNQYLPLILASPLLSLLF